MYDRMALTIPGWTERHAPDEGVALVEVLAYTGDYLSYLQDAVATEAYLGTARQRISVRRHARLVDYVMHDGCNARTWVCLSVAPAVPSAKIDFDPSPSPSPLKPPVQFLTGIQAAGSSLPVVFEVVSPRSLTVYQAHNEIYFYTWGNRECCLSRGATTATLWSGKDAYQKDATVPLSLNPGDVLIFEEVMGPKTGVMADADSSHRQAVRLTSVTEVTDPLLGHLVYDVEWAQEDQLAFTLCISTIGAAPGCAERRNVSVARGNVVLVDQGETVFDQMTVPPAPIAVAECVAVGQERDVPQSAPEFSPPPLAQYPVTQSVPFPVPGPIAHREARVLAGLLFRVRAVLPGMVEAVKQSGQPLGGPDLNRLVTIFGKDELVELGLIEETTGDPNPLPAGDQVRALYRLLLREGRLLAKKAHRVHVLNRYARSGYILTQRDVHEILEMFGEQFTDGLEPDDPRFLGPAQAALVQDARAGARGGHAPADDFGAAVRNRVDADLRPPDKPAERPAIRGRGR